MLNAQDVRKRRLDKIKAKAEADLNDAIKPVFNWILELIDQHTRLEIFEPLKLVLRGKENKIKIRCSWYDSIYYRLGISRDKVEYDISSAIEKYGRYKFISDLADAINKVVGFEAILDDDDDDEDVPYCFEKDVYLNVNVKE